MRKVVYLILIAIILSACGGIGASPTPSDAEMATRVAEILTEMPPATSMPTQKLPQGEQPASEAELQSGDEPATSGEGNGEPSAEASVATEVPTEIPPTEVPTVAQPQGPTATLVSTDLLNTLGNPTSTDPMDSAVKWVWWEGADEYTNVEFVDGSMKFSSLDEITGWRLPVIESASNMYIEMTVSTANCSGEDNYGIIFRVPIRNEADRGYLFAVSCEGKYELWEWDGKIEPNGKRITLLCWQTPKNDAKDAINTGSNATNRLGVKTDGYDISLYANGYLLHEIVDTTFPGGYFGIFINSEETEDFYVLIDEMSYWILP